MSFLGSAPFRQTDIDRHARYIPSPPATSSSNPEPHPYPSPIIPISTTLLCQLTHARWATAVCLALPTVCSVSDHSVLLEYTFQQHRWWTQFSRKRFFPQQTNQQHKIIFQNKISHRGGFSLTSFSNLTPANIILQRAETIAVKLLKSNLTKLTTFLTTWEHIDIIVVGVGGRGKRRKKNLWICFSLKTMLLKAFLLLHFVCVTLISPNKCKLDIAMLLTYAGASIGMKSVSVSTCTVVGPLSVRTALLAATIPYCAFINI